MAAQQTGFGKIFVLNGTIRFAEQYEFLFFDEPCEKHVIRSEPYFSLLVAHDERKAIRRGAVQASFRNCTLVPLTMMEICSEAIDLCAGLVGTTNPNVVSDLGIAALTLKTAMESAWLNVLINLSSLKDKAFRDECCQKGEALLAHAVPIAQESYEKVIKVITEK